MKKLLAAACFLVVLPAAAQVAEHCTHREGVLAAGFADAPQGSRELSLEAVLVSVGEGFVVVENAGTGQRARLPVARRIKLRAARELRRGNKKKLTLADFENGQTVRVTLRTDSGEAVAMRLLAR